MIKWISLAALVLALLTPNGAKAQAAAHEVDLTWMASVDSTAATPGTVSVFRAPGSCPSDGTLGTLTFSQLSSTAPAAGPYKDLSVTVGSWCYYVKANINGSTSGPSNTAGGAILTAPPTGITIVIVK